MKKTRSSDCAPSTAIEVTTDHEPAASIRTALDRGEAVALQAAIERDGTLATDDRNVLLPGSVGILVRLVERNDLTADEADTILHQWSTEYRYRLPVESVHDVLDTD